MNQNYFDALTRTLSSMPSRRDVLRGLAGTGLGLGVAQFSEVGDAKKKRKRKKHKKRKPKATPNEFGCLEVDDPCTSADDCCSGICEGMKRDRKCRAHGTGTCDQQGPEICSIDPPIALTCNNDATCRCFGTTAGSIVCSRINDTNCADCQRDADCEAVGFPPGSVCAPVSIGACAGQCETGMACLIPCGSELPEPEA